MKTNLIAVTTLVSLLGIAGAAHASTEDAEPPMSDRVFRFEDPGAAVVFSPEEGLALLFNFESVEDFCTGTLAGAGDGTGFRRDDGTEFVIVRDEVPAIAVSIAEFPTMCADPSAVTPVSTGDARVLLFGDTRTQTSDIFIRGSLGEGRERQSILARVLLDISTSPATLLSSEVAIH